MNLPVGFTGTQKGMTAEQEKALRSELVEAVRVANMARVGVVLHHGDCVGSDLQAHRLAYQLGLKVIIHPPENDSKRAYANSGIFRSSSTLELPPKQYLDRNRDIVDAARALIATPGGPEVLRSGTWATIRYARTVGRDMVIIYPDGSIERKVY